MDNEITKKKELARESKILIDSIKTEFGLSQKQIAEHIQRSTGTISKLQSDKREHMSEVSLETRLKLFDKLKELELNLRKEKKDTRTSVTPQANLDRHENYISTLGKKESIKTTILAATISGVFSCFVTIVGKDYMGYSNLDLSKLHQIIPGMLMFFILLGIVIGWTCSYCSWRILIKKKQVVSSLALAAIITFFSTILFRGLKARDSYLMSHFIPEIEGKGLLGEPNFEVLATALSISVSVIFIIRFLTTKKKYSHSDALFLSTFTAILSTIIFITIFFMFKFMVATNIIVAGKSPFSLSTAFFKFSFSHPDRTIWIWLIAFSFTYTITNFLRLKAIQIE